MWHAVDTWETEKLVKAAGIVSGLSKENLAKLKLDSTDAASAIGKHGNWTATKVSDHLSIVLSALPRIGGYGHVANAGCRDGSGTLGDSSA